MTRDEVEAIVRLFRSIGMYWMFVGAIDEGIRWGETAVQAASRLGRVDAQLSTLVILSEFLRYSGESDRAIELKTDVLGLARAIGDHTMIAVTLGDMASIHATRGEFALAHALLAEAQDVHDRERSTDVMERVHTIVTMAEVALMEGDVAEAERHVAVATDLESGADLPPDWIVESMSLTAKTLHAGGHDVEAESLLRAVVGDAAEIGIRMPLVDSLEVLAAIVSAREPEEAARFLGMADRLRAEARVGVWDPAERERTIAAVREVVGDATFTRCHAEGRAMSMPAIVEAVLHSAGEVAGP